MEHFKSINPATEALIATYQVMPPEEVESRIGQAHRAFLTWKTVSISERAKYLEKAADILDEKRNEFARLITLEMGKILSEAEAEVTKCAWTCRHYAQHAAGFLAPERIATDAVLSYVDFQPLGVLLAVMPWNFPFYQVFRFAAPALMAGNAGLLKHASNVTGCARAIQSVFEEAGVPEGLFSHLAIPGSRVAGVIEHPLVKAVTLTGSEKAGSSVAAHAGKHIKKTVLELGGSDAYLILEDADLDLAAEVCAYSRLINAGQSCIGAKRFIPVAAIYDEFLERFRARMAEPILGDPFDRTADMGPLARLDLREQLHIQVLQSMEKGAKCILGGQMLPAPGAFYPPTILTEVQKGMPAYDEELFGPVASVIRAKDERDAIRIANDSMFGLGSAVFSQDLARAEAIAAKDLEAGSCFVNSFVRSDPRLPFGGIKTSGYGRELSRYGILEFVNIKTIYVA
ncbi:MAG: NAD-dependent succinate-semialdehyde dehydrogenase [Saprospirales bacterium]|nr:NAD-dependent succinate-semialdehyde dehydrogenase [Saprospirales bacterium]